MEKKLEMRPDDGPFEKLHADFSDLGYALEMLSNAQVYVIEGSFVRSKEVSTNFGEIRMCEVVNEEGVKHIVTLTNPSKFVRGFSFMNGELDKIIGYNPYVSNKEIKRFLQGVGEQFAISDGVEDK